MQRVQVLLRSVLQQARGSAQVTQSSTSTSWFFRQKISLYLTCCVLLHQDADKEAASNTGLAFKALQVCWTSESIHEALIQSRLSARTAIAEHGEIKMHFFECKILSYFLPGIWICGIFSSSLTTQSTRSAFMICSHLSSTAAVARIEDTTSAWWRVTACGCCLTTTSSRWLYTSISLTSIQLYSRKKPIHFLYFL